MLKAFIRKPLGIQKGYVYWENTIIEDFMNKSLADAAHEIFKRDGLKLTLHC